MTKGRKTKPPAPEINQLLSLSLKEEDAGYFEAALLHLWIPLEYRVKEIVWNNHKRWPDGLDPKIREIKDICREFNVAKIVIYSTSTLKKGKEHANEIKLLEIQGLKYTVKDFRNRLVHEGLFLGKREYQSCKNLIHQLTAYLDTKHT